MLPKIPGKGGAGGRKGAAGGQEEEGEGWGGEGRVKMELHTNFRSSANEFVCFMTVPRGDR